jgi:hypothetical protein
MALHAKHNIGSDLLDGVYASSDLAVVMPNCRMPGKEHDPRHACQVVHDELMLEGNDRQNLATFCQSWLDPEVHQLMGGCIDKNMIDEDEYAQPAEIERRCVHILADPWNAPDAANTPGTSALFVLVRKATPDKALEALKGFKGRVLKTSLPADREKHLREGLEQGDHRSRRTGGPGRDGEPAWAGGIGFCPAGLRAPQRRGMPCRRNSRTRQSTSCWPRRMR